MSALRFVRRQSFGIAKPIGSTFAASAKDGFAEFDYRATFCYSCRHMSNGLCDFIRGNSCAALGRIRVQRGVETRRVGGAADATPGDADMPRFRA